MMMEDRLRWKNYGIKVIRFTNFEVENNIEKVIKRIETIVNERI